MLQSSQQTRGSNLMAGGGWPCCRYWLSLVVPGLFCAITAATVGEAPTQIAMDMVDVRHVFTCRHHKFTLAGRFVRFVAHSFLRLIEVASQCAGAARGCVVNRGWIRRCGCGRPAPPCTVTRTSPVVFSNDNAKRNVASSPVCATLLLKVMSFGQDTRGTASVRSIVDKPAWRRRRPWWRMGVGACGPGTAARCVLPPHADR